MRPIQFDLDVNLLDEAAVTDALRTNPACVNCHVSLDPIASYLFGFVGLLLAVPLAAAIGVLTRFAVARYRASAFYTGNGPT